MITGIGLDIVELSRIKNALQRNKRFAQRILSPKEFEKFREKKEHRQLEYLAGRFSAKEAFSKAYGTGIGAACRLHDIEILSGDNGKPILYFKKERVNGFVSITHSKEYAAAQVILVQKD